MDICEQLKRLAGIAPQLCQQYAYTESTYELRWDGEYWEICGTAADSSDLMVVCHLLKCSAISRNWAYRTYYTQGLGHEVKILAPGLWRVTSDLKNTEALAWFDAYFTADAIARATEITTPLPDVMEVGHGRS